MQKKLFLLFIVSVILVVFAGVVAAQDADCTACHNDTTIITEKAFAWELSKHGVGGSVGYAGGRASCAGCHSGSTFSDLMAAGMNYTEVEEDDPNPTRQDCRACHAIHTTYTSDDWALETVEPVDLALFDMVTFDGGKGNLCANCHQPRRAFVAEEGIGNVSSTHWGPHYGMQTSLLLGINGSFDGEVSDHYSEVENTCVTCHVANGNHTFVPTVDTCLECHDEAEDFDINGFVTEFDELFAELEGLLIEKGMLEGDEEHGYHPVVGEYPEEEAAALWNYRSLYQDHSHGIHNPLYALDLLDASIAALK